MPSIHALYVHIPFCRARCGYCDFYSEIFDPRAADPLIAALKAELHHYARHHQLHFDTIFVGGGTPTTLPPDILRDLLDAINQYRATDRPVECTLEANPATVTPELARLMHDLGVNRISLGAQSFQPAELRVLERTHEPHQVAETLQHCRAASITDANLDLIFAIPGQSLDAWRRNLERAIELAPNHLSCYGLTYEPGTRLHAKRQRGELAPTDPDLEADMYELMLDRLPAADFEHYEISNFARPNHPCRHNLRYWHNEPYLGLGPAAAGFLGEARYRNVPDLDAYLQRTRQGLSVVAESETLTPAARARETAMLNLRLRAGIDRHAFKQRFDADPAELFAQAIKPHLQDRLIEITPHAIRLTRPGFLLADTVIADFL